MKHTSKHLPPPPQNFVPVEPQEDLWVEYYQKIADKLEEWGLCGELKGHSVPLRVWAGLLQPIADLSGYRIVLQAVSSESNAALDEMPLYVDVAVATPSIFVNEARTAIVHSAASVMKGSRTAVPNSRPFSDT